MLTLPLVGQETPKTHEFSCPSENAFSAVGSEEKRILGPVNSSPSPADMLTSSVPWVHREHVLTISTREGKQI